MSILTQNFIKKNTWLKSQHVFAAFHHQCLMYQLFLLHSDLKKNQLQKISYSNDQPYTGRIFNSRITQSMTSSYVRDISSAMITKFKQFSTMGMFYITKKACVENNVYGNNFDLLFINAYFSPIQPLRCSRICSMLTRPSCQQEIFLV